MFVLKSLVDIYLSSNRRLYCCFVDYRKAFDTVNRAKLWSKILSLNINGKLFNVIHNIYSQAKSCVCINSTLSNLFPCSVGVRQGENLSPLLFSIYLSDLSSYLAERCEGLTTLENLASTVDDDTLQKFMKLFVLLYADDTVILSETPDKLQIGLDNLYRYSDLWDLRINRKKTKILVFSKGKIRRIPDFTLAGEKLDITFNYKYLGLFFNYNGKFNVAKQDLYDRANRAMFALLRKVKKIFLPIDIQLQLFDVLVAPVLLYGCEVWGHESCPKLEQLQVRFCKYILAVGKRTFNYMVNGELGVFPLNIKIKIRAVTYWARLLNTDYNKLSSNIYKLLYHLAIKNSYVSPWILYIRGILNDCGFPYLWLNQDLNCSVHWFKSVISNRLKDQFIQLWNETINRSGKCINYRMFKSEFKLENYLINLPFPSRKLLAKFRCRNHKLPIEKDCHLGLPREQRLCKKCDLSEIGDEFHYLFRCNYFVKERRKYIKCKYYNFPSTLKFEELMCKQDMPSMLNLCRFIKFIMCV